MKNKLRIPIIVMLTVLMIPSVILSQNGLEVEGKLKISQMDTITLAQDITAGNVVRLSDGTLALRQYAVGDTAQGGIVFWIDETGEHGLVCSLNDLEPTPGDLGHQWSTVEEVTGSTGDGIGAGEMNTALIIIAQRGDMDSAARLCADLEERGYDDWYLPSKTELEAMYNNLYLAGLGGFADSWYWSSTEGSNVGAWGHIYPTNNMTFDTKDKLLLVRAIRAF